MAPFSALQVANSGTSIPITQIQHIIYFFAELSPPDKSVAFDYPQLSKNAQNIRNPVPF